MKNNFCVYKHIAPNGKVYIGITGQNPTARWRGGLGYRNNAYFFKAITKYGWDNFKHEILFDGLTKTEACDLEVRLISEYGSTDPEKGYNLTSGGEHWIPTEEINRKRSESLKGRQFTQEHILHLSLSHKNPSAEIRKKISKSREGFRHTEETKKRISEHCKGIKHSPESISRVVEAHKRKVLCVETLCVYESVKKASEQTGAHETAISMCVHGKRHTAGGFHWRWAENED